MEPEPVARAAPTGRVRAAPVTRTPGPGARPSRRNDADQSLTQTIEDPELPRRRSGRERHHCTVVAERRPRCTGEDSPVVPDDARPAGLLVVGIETPRDGRRSDEVVIASTRVPRSRIVP